MTVHLIDTMEQFLAVRDTIKPVYVNSKKYGKVEIPCANTILVSTKMILANNWNPNSVPEDKMLGLEQSVLDNGFCFPVVCAWSDEDEKFIISDGFHRYTIGGPDWMDLDYIPLVQLKGGIARQMTATWQFNKCRGFHQVDLDAELIRSLIGQGLSEEEICKHLAIDMETVYRYKQLTGIAELFKNAEYSMAWEVMEAE